MKTRGEMKILFICAAGAAFSIAFLSQALSFFALAICWFSIILNLTFVWMAGYTIVQQIFINVQVENIFNGKGTFNETKNKETEKII